MYLTHGVFTHSKVRDPEDPEDDGVVMDAAVGRYHPRTGKFEVFADGFAGANKSPQGARYRPSGLAQGPDGSLYVSDDKGGRIWKIVPSR